MSSNITLQKPKDILSKILLLFLASGMLLLYGCSDDEDNPTEPQPQETSKVEGRVTDDTGFVNPVQVSVAVENATVILTRLNADGSMDTVSVEAVQTNAQGEFTIETTENNVAGLIVAATKGTTTWYGVISAEVSHNNTLQTQPLNRETTVEEKAYEISWKENNNPDYVDYSLYINSQVTSEAFGNPAVQSDISSAINAQVETLYNVLTGDNIGVTSNQINDIKEAKQAAQTRLEADLHFALGNAGAVGEAFRTFYETIIAAYTNAEVDLVDFAKAKEISTYMLVKNSGNLLPFIRNAEWMKAKVLTQAVSERFDSAGASQSILSSVTNEGLKLQGAVEASESIERINLAYDDYLNNVTSALKQFISASSQDIEDIQSGNALNESKNELRAVLNVATIPSTIIQQYFAFYNTIQSEVDTGLSNASDSDKNLVADIMILLNMHVLEQS